MTNSKVAKALQDRNLRISEFCKSSGIPRATVNGWVYNGATPKNEQAVYDKMDEAARMKRILRARVEG